MNTVPHPKYPSPERFRKRLDEYREILERYCESYCCDDPIDLECVAFVLACKRTGLEPKPEWLEGIQEKRGKVKNAT